VTLESFKAGTYIQQYQYKSFTPTRLNTEWTWSDAKVNTLLAEANLKLGELNAFSSHVPGHRHLHSHVCGEGGDHTIAPGATTQIAFKSVVN
jgi:hypothetical protein